MGRVGGLRVRCLLGAVPWPVVSRGVLVREFCSAGPFRPGGGGGGGIRRMPAAALIAVVSAVVSLLANQLGGLAFDLVSSWCLFHFFILAGSLVYASIRRFLVERFLEVLA